MAADFRLCPACGTRNKLKWEFCVKCGESLQDVQAGRGATSTPAPVADKPGAFNWQSALVTVLAVGAGLWIAIRFRPEATRPDPAFFASPAQLEAAAAKTPPAIVQAVEDGQLRDGLKQLNARDTRGALETLAQAVASNPNDAQAHLAYGHALYQAGQAEQALAQFLEAARLEPREARASVDAAKILIGLGRPADAIPLYEAALRADPASPAWLSQLARLYMDQGNPARAAQLLEQAADTSKGNARFLQELGYAWEKAGNPQAAMDAYRRALQSDPNSATTRALLAERMLATGKADDAISLVREGTGRDSKLNRALGSLLERTGRRSEAAAAYREYARQNPGATDSKAMEERAATLEASS